MNNTFEFHGRYICHHGRKGMKWGEHIYADVVSRKRNKTTERINKSYDRYNKKLSRIKVKADEHGDSLKSKIVSNLIKDNENNRSKALDMTKNATLQYFRVHQKRLQRSDMDVNSMTSRRVQRGENRYQRRLAKTISKYSNKKLSELHTMNGSTEKKLTMYIQRVSEHGGYRYLRRDKLTGLYGLSLGRLINFGNRSGVYVPTSDAYDRKITRYTV